MDTTTAASTSQDPPKEETVFLSSDIRERWKATSAARREERLRQSLQKISEEGSSSEQHRRDPPRRVHTSPKRARSRSRSPTPRLRSWADEMDEEDRRQARASRASSVTSVSQEISSRMQRAGLTSPAGRSGAAPPPNPPPATGGVRTPKSCQEVWPGDNLNTIVDTPPKVIMERLFFTVDKDNRDQWANEVTKERDKAMKQARRRKRRLFLREEFFFYTLRCHPPWTVDGIQLTDAEWIALVITQWDIPASRRPLSFDQYTTSKNIQPECDDEEEMDTGGSSPITSPNPPSATPDVPVGDPLLDPHSAAPATATTSAVRTAMEHLNWGAPVEYLFQGTAFRPQRVMPVAGFYLDANHSYVWHPKCYSLFSADDKDTIRGVCIETPTEIARDLHHKKDSSATPFFPRILAFSMRVPDKDGKMEYRYLYFFRRHPGATLPVEKDTSAYTESEINAILDSYNLPNVEDDVVRSMLTEGKYVGALPGLRTIELMRTDYPSLIYNVHADDGGIPPMTRSKQETLIYPQAIANRIGDTLKMYQARITCSIGYPRTDDTYSAYLFPQKAATIRDKLIGLCNYTLTKGKPPERGQLPAKPAYRNVLGDFVQELPIPVNPKGSPNEYFLPSTRLGFGELDGYAKRDALQKGVAERSHYLYQDHRGLIWAHHRRDNKKPPIWIHSPHALIWPDNVKDAHYRTLAHYLNSPLAITECVLYYTRCSNQQREVIHHWLKVWLRSEPRMPIPLTRPEDMGDAELLDSLLKLDIWWHTLVRPVEAPTYPTAWQRKLAENIGKPWFARKDYIRNLVDFETRLHPSLSWKHRLHTVLDAARATSGFKLSNKPPPKTMDPPGGRWARGHEAQKRAATSSLEEEFPELSATSAPIVRTSVRHDPSPLTTSPLEQIKSNLGNPTNRSMYLYNDYPEMDRAHFTLGKLEDAKSSTFHKEENRPYSFLVFGEDLDHPDRTRPLTYAEFVSWRTLLRANVLDACETHRYQVGPSGIVLSDIKFNESKGYALVQCGNQLTLTWLIGNMNTLTPIPRVICKRIDLIESYTLRLWVPKTYLQQPIAELARELKTCNGDRFRNVDHLSSLREGSAYAYTDLELSKAEATFIWGTDAPFRLWGSTGLITTHRGREPASLPHDTAIAYRQLLLQYKEITGEDPEDLVVVTTAKHFNWDDLVARPSDDDDPAIVELRNMLDNAHTDWRTALAPSYQSFNEISLPTVKKIIRDAAERDKGIISTAGNLKRPRFAEEAEPIDIEARLKEIRENKDATPRARAETISNLLRDKISQDRLLTIQKYSVSHRGGRGGSGKTSDPSKIKSSGKSSSTSTSTSKSKQPSTPKDPGSRTSTSPNKGEKEKTPPPDPGEKKATSPAKTPEKGEKEKPPPPDPEKRRSPSPKTQRSPSPKNTPPRTKTATTPPQSTSPQTTSEKTTPPKEGTEDASSTEDITMETTTPQKGEQSSPEKSPTRTTTPPPSSQEEKMDDEEDTLGLLRGSPPKDPIDLSDTEMTDQ
jgi:hypothetical protein